MESQDITSERSTVGRVEHFDVPDGDGYIRWYTINREVEVNAHEAEHDPRGKGAKPDEKGTFDYALDLVKRKLSFWR